MNVLRSKTSKRSTRRRRGMSLMEVMLATVILLGSVMTLSRVAFLARLHATGSEDRTQAQIHCQNIMQELLAGVRPLTTVSPELFEGDQWIYAIDAQPVEGLRLAEITVTVARADPEESTLPASEELDGYRLVRWMRTGRTSFDVFDEFDAAMPTGDTQWVPQERMPITRSARSARSRSSRVQNMREMAFRLRDNVTGGGGMLPPVDGEM